MVCHVASLPPCASTIFFIISTTLSRSMAGRRARRGLEDQAVLFYEMSVERRRYQGAIDGEGMHALTVSSPSPQASQSPTPHSPRARSAREIPSMHPRRGLLHRRRRRRPPFSVSRASVLRAANGFRRPTKLVSARAAAPACSIRRG